MTGENKGKGYFGEVKRPDGRVSTEIGVGVNFGGKEVEIPTMVPGLTKEEMNYLMTHDKPTPAIVKKAVEHAKKRIKEGKSPFAGPGEDTTPMP